MNKIMLVILAFAESSKLFDDTGNPVAVDWRAGTFTCSGSTSAATAAFVSPVPTQPPEAKKNVPGFEVVLVMLASCQPYNVVRYI